MQQGWQAEISLKFSRAGERTFVRPAHRGPLRIQRAFYPEGPQTAHVYMLHPPGGVVAGDSLRIQTECATRANALVTTPGATKFYNNPEAAKRRADVTRDQSFDWGVQLQEQSLRVDDGALLEWLPQETIVFDGSRARLTTRVELAPRASFAGWEILCFGRPGSGEPFAQGWVQQRFEVFRSGRPLFVERSQFDGDGDILRAKWGLGGQTVSGTLFFAAPDVTGPVSRNGGDLPALREAIDRFRGEAAEDGWATISRLEGGVVVRYLGNSAEHAKASLSRAWRALRPALFDRKSCTPRIWAT